MEIKKCEYCGAEFESKHCLQRFCCPEHQKIWAKERSRSKRAAEKVGTTIECEWCGKEFVATTVMSKFCSKQCREFAQYKVAREKRRAEKNKMLCQMCGKPIGAYHSRLYCSKKCSYQASKKNSADRDTKPKAVHKPKKPKVPISEINRIGREEHLTYGQVVAKYGF